MEGLERADIYEDAGPGSLEAERAKSRASAELVEHMCHLAVG